MNSMLYIAKRDIKSIVFSPVFLMVSSLCTFLWSFSYIKSLIQFAFNSSAPKVFNSVTVSLHQGVVTGHISLVNMVFIFVVPALTMKLICEEKNRRTYDLLMTSPVSSCQIIMGKYIAGLGASLLLLFISILYPLLSGLISEVNYSLVFSSYLGLTLMTFVYVAIGLLSSSMTRSLLLSVIMGVVFNLGLWFLSQGSTSSDNDVFIAVMEHMSVGDHLFGFVKGTFRWSSFIYFLSLSALFVFLSERVLESSRWR